MSRLEELLYSAEEHGKRQQMFKELKKVKTENPKLSSRTTIRTSISKCNENMKKSKVIQALTAQANADKAKAMMALDLLENQAVGIGDHTVNDFMKDATEALELLTDADDRLETLDKYWGEHGSLPF